MPRHKVASTISRFLAFFGTCLNTPEESTLLRAFRVSAGDAGEHLLLGLPDVDIFSSSSGCIDLGMLLIQPHSD
jgi:hypothetical protein